MNATDTIFTDSIQNNFDAISTELNSFNIDSILSKITNFNIDTLGLNTNINSIELVAIPKVPFLSNWTVVSIVVMFVLLVSIKVSSEKYLVSLIQSIFNRNTANRLFRERINNILHPAFRLDLLFYIVMGTLLLHVEKMYFNEIVFSESIVLLINIGAIIVFTNGKIILYRLSSFLFGGKNEMSEFIFYTRSAYRTMGLFIFPIAVFMYFSTGIYQEILLVLGGVITLYPLLASLLRGVGIIAKKDFSIYYLILYLCILEISPLAIVWKVLWRM